MAAKKKAKKKASKKKAVSKNNMTAEKEAVTKKKNELAKKAKPPAKVSKALSVKVNKFLLMKKNITAANKQITEMKSEAFKLETELLETMQKAEQLGITVTGGTIKIKETDTFNAKDWKKINKYIDDTGDHDLMQRRLNTTLLNDYFKAGKKIKGVEHYVKTSLGVSQAKK